MKSAPEPIAYSPRVAARVLGISRDHILLAMKLCHLPDFKIGVRTLVLRDDLVAWLRRHVSQIAEPQFCHP